MEEIGVGSGVGSDFGSGGGFDLTGAPMRPVEQRLPFTSGTSLGQAVAPVQISSAGNWAANLAAPNAAAPSSLPRPVQIADLTPLAQVAAALARAVDGGGLWRVG